MKIPKFEFTGTTAVVVIVLIFIVVFVIAHQLSGNQEIEIILDKPMRDMTIGQGMAFAMFVWFLFR